MKRKFLYNANKTLLLVMLLIIGFAFVFTAYSAYSIIQEQNGRIKAQLNEAENVFQNLINDQKVLSLYIGGNPSFLNKIKKIVNSEKENIDLEYYYDYSFVRSLLAANLAIGNQHGNLKHSIVIEFPSSDLLITSDAGLIRKDRYYDKTWLNFNHDTLNDISVVPASIKPYEYAPEIEIIRIICRIPYSSSLDSSGIIAMNINKTAFEEMIPRGIAVYSSNTKIAGKNETDMPQIEEDNNSKKSALLPFFPNTQILKSDNNLQFVIKTTYIRYPIISLLALAILCLVITIILVRYIYFINKSESKNINDILKLISQAEKGEIDDVIESSSDETPYNKIRKQIIKNFIEKKYLKIQLSERTLKQHLLELLALQNQINPHFLFNTLDAISWTILSESGYTSKAFKMLQNLNAIIKYSFYGSAEATLQEEIKCINHYIAIHQIRIGKEIAFRTDIDPLTNEIKLPKLCLQPIVENAFVHGNIQNHDNCQIMIKTSKEENNTKIIISNSGDMLPEQKINEINTLLASKSNSSALVTRRYHIGLVNTFCRIKLFYEKAGECKMSINSNKENTDVTIIIPE